MKLQALYILANAAAQLTAIVPSTVKRSLP